MECLPYDLRAVNWLIAHKAHVYIDVYMKQHEHWADVDPIEVRTVHLVDRSLDRRRRGPFADSERLTMIDDVRAVLDQAHRLMSLTLDGDFPVPFFLQCLNRVQTVHVKRNGARWPSETLDASTWPRMHTLIIGRNVEVVWSRVSDWLEQRSRTTPIRKLCVNGRVSHFIDASVVVAETVETRVSSVADLYEVIPYVQNRRVQFNWSLNVTNVENASQFATVLGTTLSQNGTVHTLHVRWCGPSADAACELVRKEIATALAKNLILRSVSVQRVPEPPETLKELVRLLDDDLGEACLALSPCAPSNDIPATLYERKIKDALDKNNLCEEHERTAWVHRWTSRRRVKSSSKR